MPKVAIIGGGYGGITLAKALDAHLDVVLIEPKDAFVHTVAALRGLVDEEWSNRIFFDYANLLTHGRVVRDRAAKVDPAGVTTANGDRIDADYIVLATGSRYPYPAKYDHDDSGTVRDNLATTRQALEGAERVLLLGAGPVGLEMAGEITHRWPGKQVTIVDPSDDVLGGRYLPELRSALREQLTERGVQLHLGTSLTEHPQAAPGTHAPFTATLANGEDITADIWFRCYGVQTDSDYLTGVLSEARLPNGAVQVDHHLRLPGQRHIFAIGDVTAVNESKRAVAAQMHAAVVAENILALAQGTDTPTKTYQPGPEFVMIPLGAAGGAAQLPGPEGPVLLDGDATAQRKGADLHVDRYAEMFSQA
ncbi:NAD(P)/FAD-dependent oxidoreductase [Streptomyces clavifer]|uniref:NAD(P)/FAD-dependent oxidoreductase n=1 Tax=Streptomyces clavifer TaxID=68188 RepID=UPI0037F244EF